MNKKKIIIILPLIILILVCVAVFLIINLGKMGSTDENNLSANGNQSTSYNYLIDQYPIKTIPLYKIVEVESSKFFYNSDAGNTSAFDESPFSYFNVVYETTASKDEVFNYYRGIFDTEIKEEFSNPESIKGVVGEYSIEISQYGDDTVYLQVYVNEAKSDNLKKDLFSYFSIVEIDRSYAKIDEKSYGLLNQNGGEIEYTHYYTISDTGDVNGDQIDDINELAEIQTIIQEKYKNNTGFSFSDNVFEWTSNKNEKYIVELSPDHSRVYAKIIKSMQ